MMPELLYVFLRHESHISIAVKNNLLDSCKLLGPVIKMYITQTKPNFAFMQQEKLIFFVLTKTILIRSEVETVMLQYSGTLLLPLNMSCFLGV